MKLLTHTDLVERAKNWLEKHGGKFACGIVLAEYRCYLPEVPDVIGFNHRRSILIECKVSRADFKADRYKPHRQANKQLGNYRYYLTFPHIACPQDIDNGWGLLYATNKRILEVKQSEYFADDSVKAAEWSILYSVARRLNLRGLLKDVQEPLPEGEK